MGGCVGGGGGVGWGGGGEKEGVGDRGERGTEEIGNGEVWVENWGQVMWVGLRGGRVRG